VSLGILRGGYESSEVAFVRRTVQPGQTVLDLGANLGYFTILMASLVGPSGRVHAFEPWARNAELLARSVDENRFGDRVTLRSAAVAERSGAGQLVSLDLPANSGGAYLDTVAAGAPSVHHRVDDVPLVALDDLDLPGPVSFVKIDIEGAEALALRGAAGLLRRDRPIVLSELAPTQLRRVSGCQPADLLDAMASLGYRCHALERGALGPTIADPDSPTPRSIVFLPTGPE
jgi:FkbM family methyltransferase